MKNFWEWMKFNESMDVVVKDFEKSHTPDNILELTNWITNKLFYQAKIVPPSGNYFRTFEPDGDDYWKESGIMNFYTQNIPPIMVDKILQAIKFFFDEDKIKYGQFKKEPWSAKMDEFEWAKKEWKITNPNTTRVIRIPILSIPKKQENAPPELNMSNAAARYFFRDVLGFADHEEDGGFFNINARDLIIKLDMLPSVNLYTKSGDEKQEPGKANIISGGYDEKRLQRYVDVIRQIAQWAIDNNYDMIDVL